MADPLWIDSNTIIYISNGNTALEAEIIALSKQRDIFYVPKSREEARIGNPLKTKKNKPWQPNRLETTEIVDKTLERLPVKLDTAATKEGLAEFRDRGFFTVDKNGNKVVDVARGVSESDAVVLTQVAASAKARGITNPEMLTSDVGIFNGAEHKRWGIKFQLPKAPIGNGPPQGGGTPPVKPAETEPAPPEPSKGAGPKPPTPAEMPGVPSRLRGLVKSAALPVGMAILAVLANYFRMKLEQRMIDQQIDDYASTVVAAIGLRKSERAAMQAKGNTPFAKVMMEAEWLDSKEYGFGPPISSPSLPVVNYKGVAIVPNGGPARAGAREVEYQGVIQKYTSQIEWYVRVPLADDDLKTYLDITHDLDWGEAMISEPSLADEDRKRVQDDFAKAKLRYERWQRDN